jgi:hypothetical protein
VIAASMVSGSKYQIDMVLDWGWDRFMDHPTIRTCLRRAKRIIHISCLPITDYASTFYRWRRLGLINLTTLTLDVTSVASTTVPTLAHRAKLFWFYIVPTMSKNDYFLLLACQL